VVCHRVWRAGEKRWKLSERKLCPPCEELAELIKTRMDAAKASGRKPPKGVVRCETCGARMKPVLWRPDAAWDYAYTCGCYNCPECRKKVHGDKPCRHGNPYLKKRNLHLVKG
jgi:hypothetical protein